MSNLEDKINQMDYPNPNSWPSNEVLQKLCTPSFASKIIQKIYIKGVVREIWRVMSNPHDGKEDCGGVGHVVLISICCAIDSISAFLTPEKPNKKTCDMYKNNNKNVSNNEVRFRFFIDSYFDEKYKANSKEMYKAFRCSSVHGWNLHQSRISGSRNDKDHLNKPDGIIHLSLYDLFDDLKKAVETYVEDLKISDELCKKFKKRYKEEVTVHEKSKSERLPSISPSDLIDVTGA